MLEQGIGKEQHADSAAEYKRASVTLALVLRVKESMEDKQSVVDAENHGHGTTADAGDQHGTADNYASVSKILLFFIININPNCRSY